jgi:hypothetical protein
MTATTNEIPMPRYLVFHQVGDRGVLYWGSNDIGEANRLILHALRAGAPYAYQRDTRPDEISPVTEEERAAMALISPTPSSVRFSASV